MTRMTAWIIALAFVFCALAFAGDQATKVTPKSEPAKATTIKVVKMKATGKVVNVTDTSLKIERSIKGSVETVEFALEKPLTTFKVGDKVMVWYITQDEKNILTKITKQGPKPIKKIVQPKENTEPSIPPIEESVPAK